MYAIIISLKKYSYRKNYPKISIIACRVPKREDNQGNVPFRV